MNSSQQHRSPTLPTLRVEARGIIFDASDVPESAAVSYCTSLVTLQSGTILAGWQNGPAKHSPTNTIRLARSLDGGDTWEQLSIPFETSWQGVPGSLFTAEMVEAEPGRLLMFTTWFDRSIPDRPLFNPETEGILRSRLLFCNSADEGSTWSNWQQLPTPDLTGCAICGPPIRWPDGTVACAFESFKEYDDPNPAQHGAWICVSRDGRRSFDEPWLVARDPAQQIYYWDERLCATGESGEFAALFWTHHRGKKRDLNVHFLRASLSHGKQARSPPLETSIPGQIAASWVTDDGRVLAFVVDRDKPGTLTLWQSADDGRTWPPDVRLVVHVHDEQAALPQVRETIDIAECWEDMGKWSFGHPAIRPLGDDWLLAWYAGPPGRMSIHWARVVKE